METHTQAKKKRYTDVPVLLSETGHEATVNILNFLLPHSVFPLFLPSPQLG